MARTVPGRPAAAPTLPPAIGYDDQTAQVAEEFVRVRTLDMCAVHDVAAAERITRATGVSLRYTTGLTSCELELGTDDPPSRWSIELGHGFRLSTDWTDLALGGTTVKKAPERGAGCDYLVPAPGGNAGLTVRALYSQAAGSGARPDYATVCRTVERYLAEVVLPAWENPPTLAEGRTAPRVPLLGKDPCAALAAGVTEVADDRERGKTFSMSNPYSCQGASGSAISAYAVEFEILSGAIDLQGQPVRLGRFTAYPSGGIGAGGCAFQIVVEPALVFSATEGTIYYGGIVIGLPSCDDTAAAEKVLENLVQQPDAPTSKPDAQRIGDLR